MPGEFKQCHLKKVDRNFNTKYRQIKTHVKN